MVKIEIINPGPGDAPLLQALLAVALGAPAQTMSVSETLQVGSVSKTVTTTAHATLGDAPNPDLPSDGVDPNAPPDFAAARGQLPNGPGALSIAGADPSSTAPAALPSTSTLPAPGLPTPAPQPAAGAPTVVLPVPAALPGGLVLDADGLPWDARIHSSKKEKNKGDQKWRAKRNVADALVATVTAELRAVMANQSAAAAPAPTTVMPLPNLPAAQPSPLPQPAGTTTMPSPQITQNTGAYSGPTTFAQFLPMVTAAEAQGRITKEQIAAALAASGCGSLPALAPFPNLVPAVYTYLFPAG